VKYPLTAELRTVSMSSRHGSLAPDLTETSKGYPCRQKQRPSLFPVLFQTIFNLFSLLNSCGSPCCVHSKRYILRGKRLKPAGTGKPIFTRFQQGYGTLARQQFFMSAFTSLPSYLQKSKHIFFSASFDIVSQCLNSDNL